MAIDGATAGLIGGIGGAAFGVIGGAVGTYFSIRNTRTAAEKRFMVRMALVIWLALVALLGVVGLNVAGILPRWAYWVAMGVFFAALSPMIVYTNKRQAALRRSHGPDEA